MAGRGKTPLAYQGRYIQAPGILQHGPPAGHRPLEALPHPELLENKITAQAAEIEQLAGDNHRLAATHVVLRQELAAAQQEIQRLRAHVGSIQTEGDIQIRVLIDKINKVEADIMAGENIKNDLRQAHIEARDLVKARQELTSQIQQASQELEKAKADIQNLPVLLAELENLRKEYQRLRAIFEYEKGANIEQVEQMKAMERNLFGMVREVERLRTDVLNADNRARAPNTYGVGYESNPPYPSPFYPPVERKGGAYVDGRSLMPTGIRPTGEGMTQHVSSNIGAAASMVDGARIPGGSGSAAVRGLTGNTVRGEPHDPSLAWRRE
ncbi:protein FLX-like 4 [Carica papaya]|uniref:protein FLX-like 4 n=1 Tax=Carica papaya TaxID=3649 RepID=UPI000B8C94BE|nr:protein FLX-like 4 [Carica papaya]